MMTEQVPAPAGDPNFGSPKTLPFSELLGGLLPETTVHNLAGEAMPQPHRSLLNHRRDMTHTLERFHGDIIRLRLLRVDQDSNGYRRQVVLETARHNRVVEFGAIKIFLERFPALAKTWILAGEVPLGAILKHFSLAFQSAPQRFFSLAIDDHLGGLMGVTPGQTVYGRCNILSDAHGFDLAHIIEILPPANHEGISIHSLDSQSDLGGIP